MAIVLDSNQSGTLCDRLGKEPQLSSLDVILPPHVLAELMLKDMRTFLLLAFTTVAVFLSITFRRTSGVLLPLLIVILALLSTVGIMDGIPDGDTTNAFKTTAERNVYLERTGYAITSGVFKCWIKILRSFR